jgi:hypothetical protein
MNSMTLCVSCLIPSYLRKPGRPKKRWLDDRHQGSGDAWTLRPRRRALDREEWAEAVGEAKGPLWNVVLRD